MSGPQQPPEHRGDETSEEVLDRMDERLSVLLPPIYRDCYGSIAPVSMGSAGLRFDREGRVAWDQMWGSFCNLAMAGGPPHKGRLLQPGAPEDVQANPAPYASVTAEIVRGIALAAGIAAAPASPGWIRLQCANDAMAGWMLRAIVVENVSARGIGSQIEVPAAPGFRLEKEIKNIITVTTKTAHYWQEHMPRRDQFAVARLLARMEAEQVLLAPPHELGTESEMHSALRRLLCDKVFEGAGLRPGGPFYSGWIGFECGDVEAAVSMMRLTLLSNVLARREETVLYVPVNPVLDPAGELAAEAVRHAWNYRKRRHLAQT